MRDPKEVFADDHSWNGNLYMLEQALFFLHNHADDLRLDDDVAMMHVYALEDALPRLRGETEEEYDDD